MPKVAFIFNGENFTIQCDEDEKMMDICEKYIQNYFSQSLIRLDFYDFKFICNEIEIDEKLTFKDLENIIDKDSKLAYLLLYAYKLNNVLIKNEKILEKFKEDDDLCILKYKIFNNEKYGKILFNEIFVINNYKNCIIIYNGNKYKLTTYLDLDEKDYNKDILEIKLSGISNIINISFMFDNCPSLTSFSNISNKMIKNINNMEHLFSGCSSLRNISGISNWDTSNITNMSGMFTGCISLKNLPDISKWNTSNVVKMNHLFSRCENLISLPDISKWNIENVDEMSFMFWQCSSLLTLPDISKWNTSNVKYMINIFSGCSSLQRLPDISKWNLINAINISSMFMNCKSLIKLPEISKWNTSNLNNISCMLKDCQSLIYIPDISKWKTDKLQFMRNTFKGCVSLLIQPKISQMNSINFINLNVDMKYIFDDCINMIYS